METITPNDVRVYGRKRGEGKNQVVTVVCLVSATIDKYKTKQYEIGVGWKPIPVSYWELDSPKKKHTIKKSYPEKTKLEKRIDEVKNNIVLTYRYFAQTGFPQSNTEFKRKYEQISGDKTVMVFYSSEGEKEFLFYKDFFIEDGKNGLLASTIGQKTEPWKPGTVKKYRTVFNGWIDFEKNNQPVSVDRFSANDLFRFKEYQVGKGVRNVTIEKMIKALKVYLKWLVRNNHLEEMVLDEIRKKPLGLPQISEKTLREVNNLALTEQHVEAIYNLTLSGKDKYLERARDLFLFQCYTGVRYSDLKALSTENLKTDHVDQMPFGYLSFVATKNSNKCVVPLNRRCKAIIEKYKNSTQGNNLFPVPTCSYLVLKAKLLAEKANLNDIVEHHSKCGSEHIIEKEPIYKLIGTHTARKTFINIALNKGIAPEKVAKMVGDSLKTILRHYVSVKDQDIFSLGAFLD